jgi:hypothetical protein
MEDELLAVEQKEWIEYFDDFNKRNHARLVRLEVSDETGRYQTVKKMPLSGVVFDQSGVEIMLQNRRVDQDSHYTHIVEKPRNVIKDLSLDGLNERLVIVDEAGFTTKLSFEPIAELTA